MTNNFSRLHGLPEPDFSNQLSLSPESISDVMASKTARDRMDLLVFGGVDGTAVFLGFLLAGPLGAAAGLVAGAVIGSLLSKSPAQIRENIIEKVRKNYNKALEEDKFDRIERLAGQLSRYREHYVANLNTLLGEQTKQLSSMRDNALAAFKRKESDRMATAHKCKEVRLSKVEPIRNKLEKFQKSLIEYMPDEFEEVDCERMQ